MKKKNNLKAWLYLLPAILFLGVFMLYPLVDVCVYSLEENFHFVSQKYSGIAARMPHFHTKTRSVDNFAATKPITLGRDVGK